MLKQVVCFKALKSLSGNTKLFCVSVLHNLVDVKLPIVKSLIMAAVSNYETSTIFYNTTRAISQKTFVFILAAVRPEISLNHPVGVCSSCVMLFKYRPSCSHMTGTFLNSYLLTMHDY
jgi:hypothetical protein